MIFLIFNIATSVNFAVEKRVIKVITIFEKPSGNENHCKSIMEEPLSSAKPSNKLKIKEKNLIIKAASSIDVTYRLQVPPTLLPEHLLEPALLPPPFPLLPPERH